MSRLKFYLITSYVLGILFFLIHNFNFEFFLLIDPLIFVVILNIPSLIIASISYLFNKKAILDFLWNYIFSNMFSFLFLDKC
jgi:hypothetical protein